MNGRDFIYWLHGAFELNRVPERLIISDKNVPIILEHIALVKKNDRDAFFENVCYIEGILSLWDIHTNPKPSDHMPMINRCIREYLNSIFTKVTSEKVTSLPAGMREKIEEDLEEVWSPYPEPPLGRESWDNHAPPASWEEFPHGGAKMGMFNDPSDRTYCFDSQLNLTC